MSETRAALDSLRAIVRLVAKTRPLPAELELTRTLRRLGLEDTRAERPKESLLIEVRRNLIAAARRPGGVASASKRDKRNAPWLLWADKDPLVEMRGLLDQIYAETAKSGAVRRARIEAWISACDPQRPAMVDCGRRLDEMLKRDDDPRFEAWRRAQARFGFFDARRGPARVAEQILAHADPVADILKAAGLDDDLRAVSGYARQVQAHLVDQLPPPLASARGEAALGRSQAFLTLGPKLRFDETAMAGRMADALLAPWRRGATGAPGEALRNRVQEFLLRHLGDPRTHPAKWRGADPEAVRLMRSWLARANLEAFFDVVADHSDENFKYRRAFWTACLARAEQMGKFVDVWLALGAQVRAHADGIAELHGNFARLKGSAGNQSIFLMKIDSTVFCEWSHSGSIRAWPEDWKNAPKLGASVYERGDLVTKCLPFPLNPRFGKGGAPDGDGLSHFNGQTGYWQGSVAELIARRCGLHLSYADFMPK